MFDVTAEHRRQRTSQHDDGRETQQRWVQPGRERIQHSEHQQQAGVDPAQFHQARVLDHRDHGERSGEPRGGASSYPDRDADYGCDHHPRGPPSDQLVSARCQNRDTGDHQDHHRDPHEEHGTGVQVDVQRT